MEEANTTRAVAKRDQLGLAITQEQQDVIVKATRQFNAQMASTGYGNHGASTTKNSMIGWLVGGGSAEDDSDLHGSLLRKRARDLDAGGGIARGATRTLATNTIGVGLVAKPAIDRDVLGLSDDAAVAWERQAKREFALWADSKWADSSGQMTFAQMQRLAYLSWKVSGDLIAMLPMRTAPGTPYETCVRLLEADRLCTPESSGESESTTLENGNRIIDGVEINHEGVVVAYHIASRHPLAGEDSTELTYTRVEAYDAEGNPVVLHVKDVERPEQRRGIPFIAAMTEQLKSLNRYLDAELMANIVAAMCTLFITNENDSSAFPMQDSIEDDEKVTQEESRIEMAAGAVYRLRAGEKPALMNPTRTNAAFDKFVDAMCTQIGSSMEIPKEVLLKVFNSNYSASRASLLEFWRKVKQERAWFVADFCKPIYEAVIAEAIAKGRLEAPGFFDDPAVRRAWCKCEWIGSNMGQIDPKKEAEAAGIRIKANLSTEEREGAELNGSDWHETVEQRKRERAAMADTANDAEVPISINDDEGDDEEDE